VTARVLVRETIAPAGVDLLREHFDVDVDSDSDLAGIIDRYDAIVVRSATKLTAELIGLASNLKVIGRAGVGVDNVDVEAATRRGIVVANAPESTVVSAAEHTIGLLVALARNIPQAHASLIAGKWERSKFGGTEVDGKTLGILGFGRIGQLVAQRALGFDMHVLAFDPFVSAERFRELGVEKAESSADLYARADFITIHLPKTPETSGWLDAEAFGKMKDGVRVINCARGELVVDEALQQALDSGKVAGAALDVFPEEPITDYALFDGYDNVVVTPHLGASTTEAQDRAGTDVARSVLLALAGDFVPDAVNVQAGGVVGEEVRPYLSLVQKLGTVVAALASKPPASVTVRVRGELAGEDVTVLPLAALRGVFGGMLEEQVTFVNAPKLAEDLGVRVELVTEPESASHRSLVTVLAALHDGGSVSVSGTLTGLDAVEKLVEINGRFYRLLPHRGTSGSRLDGSRLPAEGDRAQ